MKREMCMQEKERNVVADINWRRLRKGVTALTTALPLLIGLLPGPVTAEGRRLAHLEWIGDGSGMLGRNHPFTLDQLPQTRLKQKLQALAEPARRRGIHWLHKFDFPVADLLQLDVDPQGGIRYEDPAPPPLPAGAASTTPTAANAPAVDDVFRLHSRPGSQNVLYLDFDGHVITGTGWNTTYDPLVAKPYDSDGDPSTYSASEKAFIAEVWHRVAEDYAPFDLDVTTEEPASFGPTVGRVLITRSVDANGNAMPSNSSGGVGYLGVFGTSYYQKYSPALVYYDNLSKYAPYVSEAASHEFGHNLGLSHDGTNSGNTYYSGHGTGDISWAPIMGNSYGKNVTQWSNGNYPDANNTQDDVAIIAGKLGYLADDHGDTPATATPLTVEANGDVLVTNPETDAANDRPDNKGVIGDRNDLDVFRVTVGDGTMDLSITPAWEAFYRASRRGANLDIQARLLDAVGNEIVVTDPATATDAHLVAAVSAGTYYLEISGVGSANYDDYGSMGEYFISGQVPVAAPVNQPPVAGFSASCTGLSCTFSDQSSDPDGTITAWNWDFGDGGSANTASPSHTYGTAGSYTVVLTVTDDQGDTDQTSQVITVVNDQPQLAQPIDFTSYPPTSYGGDQDQSATGSVTVEDGGATLHLVGNRWQKIEYPYQVTPNTVLEFDFSSPNEGEVHGIGLDDDDRVTSGYIFELYGTQRWGRQSFKDYPGSGVKHYVIPVGQFYQGPMRYLFFVNDHDVSNPTAESYFSNVRLHEGDGTAGNQPPVADFSADCNNLSCNFTDASSDADGTIVAWQWRFGDGQSSTASAPSHTYALAGTYTVTLTVTDDQGASVETARQVTVTSDQPPTATAIDFSVRPPQPYGYRQDRPSTGVVEVLDGGATLHLTGNRWQMIDYPYQVTPNTVLEFDFSSPNEGEIHGIGLDDDDRLSSSRTFKVHGTQNWGRRDYDDYPGSGVKHYVIPVGQYFTGSMQYIFFANDHDVSNPTAESYFSNVRIYESQ